MNARRTAVVFGAVLLSGCGGMTTVEMRAAPPARVLTSSMPPEQVYERVLTGARGCFERVLNITGDFFATRHSGEVSGSMGSNVSFSAAFVIQVTPSSPGSAITLHLHRSLPLMTSNVERWLNGDFAACTFG